MSERKSLTPLIAGLVLVGLGTAFLLQNFIDVKIDWWRVVRLLVPAFFIYVGFSRLIRHYSWTEEELRAKPDRSALLGGLFWTGIGTALLLSFLQIAPFTSVFGKYWPVLIILFGLGKVIDFYRLQGRLQIRAREIVGLIFVILFGAFVNTADEAHLPLLNIGGILDWDDPDFTFSETSSIELRGSESLQVSNIYGNLTIEGAEGIDRIEVSLNKAVSRSSRSAAREVADRIRVVSKAEGNVLTLSTNRSEIDPGFRFKTHLTVKVPPGLRIKAVNGFGHLQVSRMAADCELENENGSLRAEYIQGNVVVRNRSQSTTVRNVAGEVTIESRRGSVRAEEIGGKVAIVTERDRVEVVKVEGEVRIKNSHGRIQVSDAAGPVFIEAPGSAVNLVQIAGPVEIDHSYDKLTVLDLQQGLQLRTEHSTVNLNDIAGLVDIEAKHADLNAGGLRAGLSIRSISSRISASDVQGPLDIDASLKKVSLSDFRGPIKVQNKDGGDIEIFSDQQLQADVTAENTNGDITLTLPSDSAFHLFAQTRGRIESNFGNDRRQGEDRVLEVTAGSGRPEIRLQSAFSTIRINTTG